jgi:hypothetical protein
MTPSLGNAATTRAVEPDRVHLVEIGHRPEMFGHIAQFADRRDVAVHRIDRLEADELWPVGRHPVEQSREIVRVVVMEDVFLGAAVADAGDHRGVVALIREHDHARQFARQGRQCRVVGDIARGKDQCCVAAVQIGELSLELEMHMAVAGDVARAAGTGADRLQCLLHRGQYRRVLAHPEIVVRAPDGDLGADPMIIGPRKPAATPLEIGKDAIASLAPQRAELPLEKTLVIHTHLIEWPRRHLSQISFNSAL